MCPSTLALRHQPNSLTRGTVTNQRSESKNITHLLPRPEEMAFSVREDALALASGSLLCRGTRDVAGEQSELNNLTFFKAGA